jgi:hypothetical protein
MIYGSDLAFIHDSAFGSFACEAAPGLIGLLRTDGITEGVVVDWLVVAVFSRVSYLLRAIPSSAWTYRCL